MKNSLFKPEAPVWKFMELLLELVKLNLLFILTSLPIITVGASITAMDSVCFKIKEKRTGYIADDYFTAFRDNFRNSTIIWIVFLLYLGSLIMTVNSGGLNRVPMIVLGIATAIVLTVVIYALAMLARFDNGLTDTIVKASFIGIAGFPYIIVIFLMIVSLVLATMTTYLTIFIALPMWILFGFSTVGYISARFFLRIFRRFTDIKYIEEIENIMNEAK